MSGVRATLRYAKALLNLAVEQKNETQVNDDMLLINETINATKELQLLLANPIIKSEKKKTILHELFSDKVSNLSTGLINLLIDNKRLPILNDVAKKYIVLFDELKGKEVAKVTTAVPLTEKLSEQVLVKVKEITGKEAIVENIVNPEIIGGFILRIGDIQYDASIANKLQVLKRQFENKSFISKL